MPLGARGLLINILVVKSLSGLEHLANYAKSDTLESPVKNEMAAEPEARIRQALGDHGLAFGPEVINSIALKGEVDAGRANLIRW